MAFYGKFQSEIEMAEMACQIKRAIRDRKGILISEHSACPKRERERERERERNTESDNLLQHVYTAIKNNTYAPVACDVNIKHPRNVSFITRLINRDARISGENFSAKSFIGYQKSDDSTAV